MSWNSSTTSSWKSAERVSSIWRNAIGPLRIPQFRRVFTSNFTFFMAMGGQGIVRTWLAFELTEQASSLGFIAAAFAIPMLLLSPFGGVLADRTERRNLILASQAAATVSELAVLGLLLTGRLEYWHLLVGAAAMGCTLPLSMPARQAIVMNIVGKQALGPAVALNMAGTNVTRVVGPALAGFLIPVLGAAGVYILNLGLYGLAILSMLRVSRVPAPSAARDVSIKANLIDGFQYVRSNRLILILLAFGLVPMFLAMPVQNLFVVFSEDVWETGPRGLGILSASSGMGAVIGSVYVASRGADAGRLRAMMVGVVAFGALLALFAVSPWFGAAVALVFMANIAASVFGTLNNTAIQLLIPDHVRGRISSFLMMSFSLPLLGALPVSIAADWFGAPTAVAVSSVAAVIGALLFYGSSRELRELDAHVHRSMTRSPE